AFETGRRRRIARRGVDSLRRPRRLVNVVLDPSATTLLLVRHAETDDNVSMRLSGWTDTDLSQRGESQVELLADHFNRQHGHIEALYASPLIRARRTAEAIGALTCHSPILLDDLREMYFGELDGRP